MYFPWDLYKVYIAYKTSSNISDDIIQNRIFCSTSMVVVHMNYIDTRL